MDQKLFYGIDFGASNSAISIISEDKILSLPLNDLGKDKTVIPTLIYYTEYENFFGYEAYLRMREIQDQTKGRFIRNIKSVLSLMEVNSTYILKKSKTFTSIVCDYLTFLKSRADELLGKDVKGAIIGRPVHFSSDPQRSLLAQSRLKEAAEKAGFEEVHFVYEPVAATIHASENLNIQNEKIALTFDFGGSTLDFHLIRIQGDKLDTLATNGVVLGGTRITKAVIQNKILHHFGYNVKYASTTYDKKNNETGVVSVPNFLPLSLIDNDVNRRGDRRVFESIKRIQWDSKERIQELNQLEYCIRHKLYYHLFDNVDLTKIKLSSQEQACIEFTEHNFDIVENIDRKEFEKILVTFQKEIQVKFDELLGDADIEPEQVDLIIRVGGSSEIPYFIKLLKENFPRAEILKSDIFNGVSKGLARLGQNQEKFYFVA